MDPSVGVIVPVYNRERVVVEALASAVAQTQPPHRLIIVDDGSTDNTVPAIQRWMASHAPAAKLVSRPHAGAAAARNYGATLATDCEFLAFLDSDDTWPPDFLVRTTAKLRAHPNAVAATCDRLIVNLKTRTERLHSFADLNGRVTGKLFERGTPSTSTTVIRVSAFRAIGGLDESLVRAQDYNLFLRLSLLGSWVHVPGTPIAYRDFTDVVYGGQAQISANAGTSLGKLRQRAEMLERFVVEQGGKQAMPARLWQRRLGKQWYQVGRLCQELGRTDDAQDCFRRAARIDPRACRARWALWRAGAPRDTRTSQTS